MKWNPKRREKLFYLGHGQLNGNYVQDIKFVRKTDLGRSKVSGHKSHT